MSMTKHLVIMAVSLAAALSSCRSSNLDDAFDASSFGYAAAIEDIRLLPEARTQFKARNYGKSYALFKKSAEVYPNNPAAWLGLAASADQLGQFDTADTAYGALAKLIPGTVEYFNNIGYSALLRGELRSAARHFAKAQALAPRSVTVANNLRLLRNSVSRAKRS